MSTTPAAALQPTRFGSGQAVRRLEDDALLAGAGQFTDDVTEPEQAALFFVRSPYPHARIVAVDSTAALAMPGVLKIVTGADLAAAGVKPIPGSSGFPRADGSPGVSPVRRVLAHERVRFVGEAVAAVSAGNTGALMALSMFILRKVEGVHRPALVGSWPTRKGVCAMLDLGADIAADATQLVEFAIMGAAFARAVHGVQNPRVALLNIGEEELKGHESIREGARLMRESGLPIDFRGFIEPDKIGHGLVDVVVTDGFTGNVAIKTAEGIARMIADMLKDAFKSGPIAMLGAALVLPAMKSFRAKMDPRSTNGGVFLGLNGVVVKSHGGTDDVGFAQAVKVAASMGESSFLAEVAENLRRLAPAATAAPAEQVAH